MEKRAESCPEVWGNGTSEVSGHADPGPQQKEAKNERETWSVWATTSESAYNHQSPSPTSQLPFFSRPFCQWLLESFSAFILKVPAANTCLSGHWLTPKDQRVRFPNINVPQENNPFCQAHVGYESLRLSGISFNQLQCSGLLLQSHLTGRHQCRNCEETPPSPFCGPAMRSHPFQSLCGSQGSAVDIAHSDSSLFRHPRSLAVEEIKGFFWNHHGKENICSVAVPLQMCSYAPWLEV